MQVDALRRLLVVDNAPWVDRFTLYVANQSETESDVLMVPPLHIPVHVVWDDEDLRSAIREIFPTASGFAHDGGRIAFTISGNDQVLLALMERGETPFCKLCEGGGWVQCYSPNPPAFQECPECHNPFEFSSP